MSEMVDILDETFTVVSSETKQKAHELGLLHACVIGELKDSAGNWILVKQASDRQDPGQFVSPVGGHIRAGEDYLEALKRETFEELGLKKFEYSYIGREVLNREVIGRKENHLFILYELYSDEQLRLNHESVAYEKFTDDQLADEIKCKPNKFGAAFHFVVSVFYPHLIG